MYLLTLHVNRTSRACRYIHVSVQAIAPRDSRLGKLFTFSMVNNTCIHTCMSSTKIKRRPIGSPSGSVEPDWASDQL